MENINITYLLAYQNIYQRISTYVQRINSISLAFLTYKELTHNGRLTCRTYAQRA